MYKGTVHSPGYVPWLNQEEEETMRKSLETLIKEEGNDLNLHNALTLFETFARKLVTGLPSPGCLHIYSRYIGY